MSDQASRVWTCFHCGETFTTPGSARDHFGADPLAEPGCRIKAGAERGLLMALRKAEEELARHRQEDSVIARELHRLQSEFSDKLQSAEELGYERGLASAKRAQEAERKDVERHELQEIADGAWGDGPLDRGMARDRLSEMGDH